MLCYILPNMARCPLFFEPPAKRFCPAKEAHTCSVFCGTKREVVEELQISLRLIDGDVLGGSTALARHSEPWKAVSTMRLSRIGTCGRRCSID